MCIKNYVGYRCGHRDPEGTVLKTDYCRRPWRYEHEPPCPFKYRVHLRTELSLPQDGDFCPACRELRAEVWKRWGDLYVVWNREGLVSDMDQKVTHKRIQDSFAYVEKKATLAIITQGPDHTVQNEYRERQDQILTPLKQQVARLRVASQEWNLKMTQAKRDGKVSQPALEVLKISYKKILDLTRPNAWSVNLFLAQQAHLLDQLKAEEEKFDNKEEHGSDPSENIA